MIWETVKAVTPTGIKTETGFKRAIGNKRFKVGDRVLTANGFVMGHEPYRNSNPPVPVQDCYITASGNQVYIYNKKLALVSSFIISDTVNIVSFATEREKIALIINEDGKLKGYEVQNKVKLLFEINEPNVEVAEIFYIDGKVRAYAYKAEEKEEIFQGVKIQMPDVVFYTYSEGALSKESLGDKFKNYISCLIKTYKKLSNLSSGNDIELNIECVKNFHEKDFGITAYVDLKSYEDYEDVQKEISIWGRTEGFLNDGKPFFEYFNQGTRYNDICGNKASCGDKKHGFNETVSKGEVEEYRDYKINDSFTIRKAGSKTYLIFKGRHYLFADEYGGRGSMAAIYKYDFYYDKDDKKIRDNFGGYSSGSKFIFKPISIYSGGLSVTYPSCSVTLNAGKYVSKIKRAGLENYYTHEYLGELEFINERYKDHYISILCVPNPPKEGSVEIIEWGHEDYAGGASEGPSDDDDDIAGVEEFFVINTVYPENDPHPIKQPIDKIYHYKVYYDSDYSIVSYENELFISMPSVDQAKYYLKVDKDENGKKIYTITTHGYTRDREYNAYLVKYKNDECVFKKDITHEFYSVQQIFINQMHQYCRGTHKLNSMPFEVSVTPIITDFDTLDHYIDFYCGTYEGKECTVPCNYLKCYSYSAYLTIKNDSSYWGSVRFETWANIHESYKSNHMHKLNQKMISNESGDKRGKIEVVISNEDIGIALSEKISFINNNKTYIWEDSCQLLYIIGRIKNMTEISGKLIINSYILSDGKIIDSLEGGNNHLCLSKAKNCLEKFKLVKEGK